jgi:uncharacterized protein with ParB-like and HNH nuclease domain
MQPIRQNVHQVFDISRRLVVPLYQRSYVWKKEDHWEPFFQDIRSEARNCFFGKEGPGHFLGPIVTQTEMLTGGGHPKYNIIDGQQRLTTFQLFLKALHLIAADKKHWAANELERLIQNPPRSHIGPEEAFKVWPTNTDREAFRRVMEIPSAALASKLNLTNRLVEAFHFFFESLAAFLSGSEEELSDDFTAADPAKKIEALQQALTSKLYFIVLELEAGDDPQVIFETLNARGEPLLPSDLIRNDLFLSALREGLDTDKIFRKYWAPFEETLLSEPQEKEARFWHVLDTQGRLYRPRIDLFVFHWLTMKRAMAQEQDELLIGSLYREFKSWRKEQKLSAEEIFADLAENRDDYVRLIAPSGKSAISTTAQRIKAIDTGTIYPLLLFLINQFKPELDNSDIRKILNILESYLIRRLLTHGTTKNYNRVFLSLLAKAADAKAESLADFFDQELSGLKGATVEWPDDEKLRMGVLTNPIYVKSRQDRVRMVLGAIENKMRAISGTKTEEPLTNFTLTIEHLLPQEGRIADYPYPKWDRGLNESDTPEQRRERLIHSLGNLTLLTQPLNSSISNGPFVDKRKEIVEHSVLRLNRFLAGDVAPKTWDENAIHFRGGQLFELIRLIWPGPSRATVEGEAEIEASGNSLIEGRREAIARALGDREKTNLQKTSGAHYRNSDGTIRAICVISKRHENRTWPYWYGFHSEWDQYLSQGAKSYLVLGCLDRNSAYAVPITDFRKIQMYLRRTPNKHWHVDLEEGLGGNLNIVVPNSKGLPLKDYEINP